MTLGEWYRYIIEELSKIYEPGEAKTMTRLIFEDALQINAVEFFLRSKHELRTETATKLSEIINRLLQHEPLQYVTGISEFYNLKFKVDRRVLIPRPETEELVKWIIDDVKKSSQNITPKILDIGTGSGCIAIALKKNLPNSVVYAMDISDDALIVSKENAAINKADIEFIKEDILNFSDNAINNNYDIIVSNPPYIKKSEQRQMQSNVLDYEPHLALFVDDNDALLFYKAISKFASTALNPTGNLYFEINESSGKETEQLLKETSFQNVVIRKDLNGKERMMRCDTPIKRFYK